MQSTKQDEKAQATGSQTTVGRILYGETDAGVRATWRVLLSMAVFAGIVVVGETVSDAAELPAVVTEMSLPYLAAVAGAVAVVVGLSDRSAGDVGFGVDGVWLRDLAAGVGLGLVFQVAVTVVWAGTGGLTVTDTTVSGVTTGAASLAVVTGVALFGVLVTALWEEFVFRSLLIRNVAEGLVARSVSRTTALGGAVVVSGLVFGIPHALGVAAEYTNPMFGALQALISVSYFVVAYAATGSLALPIGIHFASNAWVKLVVGRVGSPYPKLFVAERTVAGAVDTLLILIPGALLVALVLWWARFTGRAGLSIKDAYRRISQDS
jgi:membrane protease YdiL (CAAX protease family)